MQKQELLNLLINSKVIGPSGKRKSCWKKYFIGYCKNAFIEYAKNYRTETEAWFCLLNDTEPKMCKICGNIAKFNGSKKGGGYNTVCEHCSANCVEDKKKLFNKTISLRTPDDKKQIFKKRQQTNKLRYGDANYTLFGSKSFKENLHIKYGNSYYNNRPLAEKTCMQKYGVKNNLLLRTSDDIKQLWQDKHNEIISKRENTCLEKYNVKNYVETEEFKQKSELTQISHYGSIKNAYYIRKIASENTKLLKYNDANYNNSVKIQNTISKEHEQFEQSHNCIKYTTCIKLYGQGWKQLNIPIIYNKRYRYIENKYIPLIKEYYNESIKLLHGTSIGEIELYNFIKTITNEDIIRNTRNIISDGINNYELDIYIPKLHIAFEYNGNYWHSSLFKDKYYHQLKTKLCYINNIQLIHIYEYDWITQKEIIKQHIYELLNNNDCSCYNWISCDDYISNKYILSEPNKIIINNLIIYDEGKFVKI